MMAKYPPARGISLSAIPSNPNRLDANGCDCENGDYTDDQAAQFAKDKLARGQVPLIYCSWAMWADVKSQCILIGVNPSSVDWFIAAYPGIGAGILYPGSIGHQYADVGLYDESVVLDGYVPGRLVNTPVSNAPTSTGAPTMAIEDIANSKQDAFNCQVREWWGEIRKSMLTTQDVDILWWCYNTTWHESADAVLATIIDAGTKAGDLKPAWAGAA
jgi:hypothetical protein